MPKGLMNGIYEMAKQGNVQAQLFMFICVSYVGEQVSEWIEESD